MAATLLADRGAFLDKRSPAYIGSIANFLANDRIIKSYRNLAGAVRKGGTVATSTVSPNDPVWVEFARSMAPFLGMVAGVLAPMVATPGRTQKVLDIAAGHGLFGLRVAQANPSATVYGTDWADVLSVAVENASALGVADRYHTIPGSAFDVDLGRGYDWCWCRTSCTTSTRPRIPVCWQNSVAR